MPSPTKVYLATSYWSRYGCLDERVSVYVEKTDGLAAAPIGLDFVFANYCLP